MKVFNGIEELAAAEGTQLGPTDWLEITQERVNLFADATGDHQWIHVDPQKAAQGPFGTTIAHGYLTLSLLPVFNEEIYTVANIAMGMNYGTNKVRFPAPVPVGSRLRATATLKEAATIAIGTRFTIEFVVEAEGSDKPVLVAEVLYVMAGV